MARIRTIKPEFFTSEQVAECSTTVRLLFVGMWCFADDNGIHPWSPKQLKMEVFPGDDITSDDVSRMLDELHANGLIRRFRCENGRDFLQISGWHHQKIDKPRYRYPTPDQGKFVDHSTTVRGMVDERSTNGRLSTRPDRKGGEGNGREGKQEQPSVVCPAPSATEPDCPPDEPTEFVFPTKGKIRTWTLGRSKLAEYIESFPGLDVPAELRKARQWARDNPQRQKTARGMPAFLSRWLTQANDRPRAGPLVGNGKARRSLDDLLGTRKPIASEAAT